MISASRPFWEEPTGHEAALAQDVVVRGVHLVAMPVALLHDVRAVGGRGLRPGLQIARAARPAASSRPDRSRPSVRAAGRSPGAASPGRTRRSSRPRGRRRSARTRSPRTAGPGRCRGTARHAPARTAPPRPCPPRRGRRTRPGPGSRRARRAPPRGRTAEVVGGEPADAHVAAVLEAAVPERLHHRQVRVAQVHVLPDDGDIDRVGRPRAPAPRGRSTRQVGLAVDPQMLGEEHVSSPSRCRTSGTS